MSEQHGNHWSEGHDSERRGVGGWGQVTDELYEQKGRRKEISQIRMEIGMRRGKRCNLRRESNGWRSVVKMRKGSKHETVKCWFRQAQLLMNPKVCGTSFYRSCMSGFHELLTLKPSSLFMSFGCNSNFIASIIRRSMWPHLLDGILVS